jgi:hypothetical protein
VLDPVDEHVDAGSESLVPVVEPDVLAEAIRVGKRSPGSDRKNSWSRILVAASRTRCSLIEIRGLLTSKPMV